MKTALSLGLALLAFARARADGFRSHAVNCGRLMTLRGGNFGRGAPGPFRHGHSGYGDVGRANHGGYYRGGYAYFPADDYDDGDGAGYPYCGSFRDGGVAGAGLLLGALPGFPPLPSLP
ncbi:MAG TPA: hypothetical protein VM029_15965 [Opitutaceae bacterium]|nr:hypothetical protein [Opitutaceae bacterium]